MGHIEANGNRAAGAFEDAARGPIKKTNDLLPRFVQQFASWRTRRRLARGRVSTVWFSTPILILPLLARCDRMLGFSSRSLVFDVYHTSRRFDWNLRLPDRAMRKFLPTVWRMWRRWLLALVSAEVDVAHMFYDAGLMPKPPERGLRSDELDHYAGSAIRVYTYAYGADVRERSETLSWGEPNLCAACPEPGRFCICNRDQWRGAMDRLEGRTTARLSMGDMLPYVPGALPLHYWPIDTDHFTALSRSIRFPCHRPRETLRVAHAPNHDFFKGTALLEAAVLNLCKRGYSIELVRVTGVPNEEVLRLFASCHVVADQFISGFHGYTALEAMALGKPVLCYIRDPDWPAGGTDCPIVDTHPDEISAVLARCAEGKIDLERIGRAGRAYVARYASMEAVAARLGRLYLETAGFPETINAPLRLRVAALEAEIERMAKRVDAA